jgi:MoxR-like ATPase
MNTARIFRALWFTPGVNGRWGLPIIVRGKPGTGKTSLIGQTARSCGLHMETIIASLREPADFLGLPIPQYPTVGPDRVAADVERALVPRVHYAAPAWAIAMVEAKRGVVFFDELNTAPPAVQAALLRVTLEGVVGDRQLPPTVRFAAACNAVEDAGGYDFSMPLANRHGHIEWDAPSVDAWGDYMMGESESGEALDPARAEALEAQVMTRWATPYARAKGTVVSFLRKRRELLLKVPTSASAEASSAFPSPRTWEMATRAIAGAEVHGLSMAETDELVTAFVGRGAAKELAAYTKEVDLPDPADLLDGKVKFTGDQRLDRTFAVMGACAALVCPVEAAKRTDRAKAFWKLLSAVSEDGADLAVPAARALIRAGLASGNKDLVKEAIPTLVRLAPVLEAAGFKVGKDGAK